MRGSAWLWVAVAGLVACAAPRDVPGPVAPSTPASPAAAMCAPGQVNAKGVGKPCRTREDCAGLWANFCDVLVNPKRPPMCSRLCDDDTDCGPGAMCGILNGVRHCYPAQCSQWRYWPGCEKTEVHCRDAGAEKVAPGDEPRHAGAIACLAGLAWSPEGHGLRCDRTAVEKHGGTCKGRFARSCQATFNPDGPDFCERECWAESTCDTYGYCGFQWPVKSFSFCWPRCPELHHRAVVDKPAHLDVCLAEGGGVPAGNPHGVGRRCKTDVDCHGSGAARTCGLSLTGSDRRPDVCTLPCSRDEDCGRNAVCTDLDFNAKGDGKGSGRQRYCVPACWAL